MNYKKKRKKSIYSKNLTLFTSFVVPIYRLLQMTYLLIHMISSQRELPEMTIGTQTRITQFFWEMLKVHFVV